MFQKYTDQQIMQDIRSGGKMRENTWRYISENWGGYCCSTAIGRTDCLKEEATTAFSIAVAGVDKRIRGTEGNDFLKTASLKTYLSASTIYAAQAIMRGRKKYTDFDKEEPGEDLSNWFRQKDCRKILEKALASIGERCKKILLLFNDEVNMKEITEKMGFRNEDVAKTEKWQCQVKFKEYLIANPHIKNLLRENCYG